MTAPPEPSTPARRRTRWLAVGLVALLAVGAAIGLLRRSGGLPGGGPPDRRQQDPRVAYRGPFRNVRPEVAYVGDGACRDCHRDISDSYARHPMGRSLAPIAEVIGRPPHAGPARVEGLGAAFRVERDGPKARHTMTLLDDQGGAIDSLPFDVAYVVGSGTRGFSYLSERGGRLFQTPVSWFSQKGAWDVSPGFTPELARGRPAGPDCLTCHANRPRPVEGTVNAYQTPPFEGHAIGCERCHGPGGLHVRERSGGPPVDGPADVTIVNPRRLDPALHEAVCQQCHLTGLARVPSEGRGLDDFRPGLPLERFQTTLVRDRAAGNRKAVNHVEQMHLSRCFERSPGGGKLGCTSCHDPHATVPPERRVEFYRSRCLECHRDRGCSSPPEVRRAQSAEDSCVGCHMPRYSATDIPHVAGTDHHIVRRPAPPEEAEDGRPPVPFGRRWPDPDDPGLARDVGVGLARLAAAGKGDPARLAHDALGLLPAGAADLPAAEARGHALIVLGRKADALAAFEQVLGAAPRREQALYAAAMLAQNAGHRERTLDYWRRAVEVNPYAPDYRANLATVLAHTGAWEEAREHCQAWVRLDPGSRPARELWARCLRRQGRYEAAQAQEEIARRLR